MDPLLGCKATSIIGRLLVWFVGLWRRARRCAVARRVGGTSAVLGSRSWRIHGRVLPALFVRAPAHSRSFSVVDGRLSGSWNAGRNADVAQRGLGDVGGGEDGSGGS